MSWTSDSPNATTWGFRIGSPLVAALALALILMLQFRRDLEPDYLRTVSRTYFNRDGFCFSFVVRAVEGIAVMDAYFQSQYDRPSIGRIAVRPARGFWMTRAKIDAITFEIECPPAGFGFARVAVPIPEKLQGKRQSFQVGASVRYPEGKGRRVRFRDGVFLRSNTTFSDSFTTAVMIAGAATGSIVLSKPATARVHLPHDVREEIPSDIGPKRSVLWKLGDPPFEQPPC